MQQQFVLSINNTGDTFRWCWLHDGEPQTPASGNLEALRAAVFQPAQQVWLLLPGSKVVTRELEYTEKEKKHLRNLLPFQLEDTVIGDIDDLHFALGDANAGKVSLAYTDKSWLRSVFAQLTEIGLEVTSCWPIHLLLPLQDQTAGQIEPSVDELAAESLEARPSPTWALSLQEGTVNVRTAAQQGFSLPHTYFAAALELLIKEQNLTENPPYFELRAANQVELKLLQAGLPSHLTSRVKTKTIGDDWQLDFNGKSIDLCQAEFSQRLPIERWLKLWRGIGILAAVTLAVYLGVTMFHIYKLNKQNVVLRQQMEEVYRGVISRGQSDDPEKRLRIKLSELQPKAQTGSAVALLAGVLPLFASNPDVTVKVISYSADTGEVSINVQAHSFNSIESLRQSVAGQGYNAELLTVNTSGEISSGRLKISKPLH